MSDAKVLRVKLLNEFVLSLPGPVRDTYLIAFNQHDMRGQRCNPANPFAGLFAVLDRMVEDERRLEEKLKTCRWRRNRREDLCKPDVVGAPQVERRGAEVEQMLDAALKGIRAVLSEGERGAIESERFGHVVATLRWNDRALRQIAATEAWEAEARRQAQRRRFMQLFRR